MNNRSLVGHTHTIANITNLQNELNYRLLLTGVRMAGDLRIMPNSGPSRIFISVNDNTSTSDAFVYFQHQFNSTGRVGTVGPFDAQRPLE